MQSLWCKDSFIITSTQIFTSIVWYYNQFAQVYCRVGKTVFIYSFGWVYPWVFHPNPSMRGVPAWCITQGGQLQFLKQCPDTNKEQATKIFHTSSLNIMQTRTWKSWTVLFVGCRVLAAPLRKTRLHLEERYLGVLLKWERHRGLSTDGALAFSSTPKPNGTGFDPPMAAVYQ